MKSLIIGFLIVFAIYSLNNFRSFSDSVLQEWLLTQNIYTNTRAVELCEPYAEEARIKLHDDGLEARTDFTTQHKAPLCDYFTQTAQILNKMRTTGKAELSSYTITTEGFPWRSANVEYQTISRLTSPNKLNLTLTTDTSLKIHNRILGGYTITDAEIDTKYNYRPQ